MGVADRTIGTAEAGDRYSRPLRKKAGNQIALIAADIGFNIHAAGGDGQMIHVPMGFFVFTKMAGHAGANAAGPVGAAGVNIDA